MMEPNLTTARPERCFNSRNNPQSARLPLNCEMKRIQQGTAQPLYGRLRFITSDVQLNMGLHLLSSGCSGELGSKRPSTSALRAEVGSNTAL